MMNYPIRIDNIIFSIALILTGLKITYDGWFMLKNRKMILYPSEKLNLFLVGLIKGETARSLLLEKYAKPRNIKLMGVNAIIGGVLLLVAGFLLLSTNSFAN